MSMDYCAIIISVMAALLVLLVAEYQAGVRNNREVKKSLDHQFRESIKKKILAEYTGTPIPPADLPQVSVDLRDYWKLRKSQTRHTAWLWIFMALGVTMGTTIILVLGWAALAKPSDNDKIPADSWLALSSLLVTVIFMILLVVGFGMRHRAARHFRVLHTRMERGREYGVDDWEALGATYERWDKFANPGWSGPFGSVILSVFPGVQAIIAMHREYRATQRRYFE